MLCPPWGVLSCQATDVQRLRLAATSRFTKEAEAVLQSTEPLRLSSAELWTAGAAVCGSSQSMVVAIRLWLRPQAFAVGLQAGGLDQDQTDLCEFATVGRQQLHLMHAQSSKSAFWISCWNLNESFFMV